VNIAFHCLGTEEGFAEPCDAFIRVNQDPKQIAPFLDTDGLQLGDFHVSSHGSSSRSCLGEVAPFRKLFPAVAVRKKAEKLMVPPSPTL
jgi:hypothetical protein